MSYRIVFPPETLGITQRALKALRDELANRIDHEILVYEAPSSDGEQCAIYGIFLIDKTVQEIVIIGDGFRGDNSGEGGAGHRAAQALMSIYGLRPLELFPDEYGVYFRSDTDPYRRYQVAVNRVLEYAETEIFQVPRVKIPQYIDWCLRARRS